MVCSERDSVTDRDKCHALSRGQHRDSDRDRVGFPPFRGEPALSRHAVTPGGAGEGAVESLDPSASGPMRSRKTEIREIRRTFFSLQETSQEICHVL